MDVNPRHSSNALPHSRGPRALGEAGQRTLETPHTTGPSAATVASRGLRQQETKQGPDQKGGQGFPTGGVDTVMSTLPAGTQVRPYRPSKNKSKNIRYTEYASEIYNFQCFLIIKFLYIFCLLL